MQFQELLDKNLKLKQKLVKSRLFHRFFLLILRSIYFFANKTSPFHRWRDMFNEMTDKFLMEITHLKTENTKLLTENQKIKFRYKQT